MRSHVICSIFAISSCTKAPCSQRGALCPGFSTRLSTRNAIPDLFVLVPVGPCHALFGDIRDRSTKSRFGSSLKFFFECLLFVFYRHALLRREVAFHDVFHGSISCKKRHDLCQPRNR